MCDMSETAFHVSIVVVWSAPRQETGTSILSYNYPFGYGSAYDSFASFVLCGGPVDVQLRVIDGAVVSTVPR